MPSPSVSLMRGSNPCSLSLSSVRPSPSESTWSGRFSKAAPSGRPSPSVSALVGSVAHLQVSDDHVYPWSRAKNRVSSPSETPSPSVS